MYFLLDSDSVCIKKKKNNKCFNPTIYWFNHLYLYDSCVAAILTGQNVATVVLIGINPIENTQNVMFTSFMVFNIHADEINGNLLLIYKYLYMNIIYYLHKTTISLFLSRQFHTNSLLEIIITHWPILKYIHLEMH